MINSPLCQDTYHSAATVVGMRHAYGIFQAEKVGQYSLELDLREGESLCHWNCKQSKPRALAQSLRLQALPAAGAVYSIRQTRPQTPSLSARDFPTAEPRSLNKIKGTSGATAPSSPAAGERRLSSPPRVLLSPKTRTSGSARAALIDELDFSQEACLLRRESFKSGIGFPCLDTSPHPPMRTWFSAPLLQRCPISLMKRSTAATEQTYWAGAVTAAPGRAPPKRITRRTRPWVAAVRLVGEPPPAQLATVAMRRLSTIRRAGWEIAEGR